MKTVILKNVDGRTLTVSIPENFDPGLIRHNYSFYVKSGEGTYAESSACEIGLDGSFHLL